LPFVNTWVTFPALDVAVLAWATGTHDAASDEGENQIMQVKGSVILITGASSGIGKDLALRMAEEGARTVLVARRSDLLEAVSEQCNKHAPSLALTCDVRERGQVEATVAEAQRRMDAPIDILVNNAGYSRWTLAKDAPVEEFEDLMRTNYFGMVYFIKAVLPSMLERRRGHLVNVASIAGKMGVGHHTHYSATKFAMVGFSEALWFELRDTGVGITVVYPGVIDTPLFEDKSFADFPAANRARMIPVRPLTEAILRAIETNRFEVTVPRYMGLGTIIRHIWPSFFRSMAVRQGG
jgi:short-subunit dehydrogenase